MLFADFICHKNSDGLFSREFNLFLVCHRGFDPDWCVTIRDEFSTLCMGGEL